MEATIRMRKQYTWGIGALLVIALLGGIIVHAEENDNTTTTATAVLIDENATTAPVPSLYNVTDTNATAGNGTLGNASTNITTTEDNSTNVTVPVINGNNPKIDALIAKYPALHFLKKMPNEKACYVARADNKTLFHDVMGVPNPNPFTAKRHPCLVLRNHGGAKKPASSGSSGGSVPPPVTPPTPPTPHVTIGAWPAEVWQEQHPGFQWCPTSDPQTKVPCPGQTW